MPRHLRGPTVQDPVGHRTGPACRAGHHLLEGRAMITAERLRQLLVYDPLTGAFHRENGRVAGGINKDGYVTVKIDGRDYLGHRLAWLYMRGEWPARGVSFRDHDRSNLRWENLRLASSRQTAQGRKASNKLG